MPPEMSASEELVIWMSSTAMKAPSMVPMTPIHLQMVIFSLEQSFGMGEMQRPVNRLSAAFLTVGGAGLSLGPEPPVVVRSIDGVTDNPATTKSSYPLMLSGSKVSLTGTRWTIFVKLPVALSGGSSA